MYQVSPSLQFGAAYAYTHDGGVGGQGNASYQQINFGADYGFSKCIDVYAFTALQKASCANSTGQSAVAAINGATPSSSDRQLVATVRMRRWF